MKIELNRVAIWLPILPENINVRRHPIGTPYQDESGAEVAAATPIYRYIKNYEKDDVRYSLLVRTLEKNEQTVEKALDKIAKGLDKPEILEALAAATSSHFTYTDNYLKNKEKK